jgi:hypothetical protein
MDSRNVRSLYVSLGQVERWLRDAHLDKDLVLEFFFVFSRFEYALKRAGYLMRSSSRAEPAWDRFGQDIQLVYDPNGASKLDRAVKYLLTHPPRRQIKSHGRLGWSDDGERGGLTEVQWLLRLVRRVRNNLFHGGKYPGGTVEEPARNTELLRNGLTLLIACHDAAPEVKRKFSERAV